jgi:hypothetical protein
LFSDSSGSGLEIEANQGSYGVIEPPDILLGGSGTIANDAGATILNTSDSALLANRGEIAQENADSNLVNAADYKADVSALALEATILTAQDSLNILMPLTREMQADVDSLILFDGYDVNSRAVAGPNNDTDTLNVFVGATRVLRFLYWHIGGATGDVPDSTTNLDN